MMPDLWNQLSEFWWWVDDAAAYSIIFAFIGLVVILAVFGKDP